MAQQAQLKGEHSQNGRYTQAKMAKSHGQKCSTVAEGAQEDGDGALQMSTGPDGFPHLMGSSMDPKDTPPSADVL